MLQTTYPVRALRAACAREGLPEETTLELVRFLQAKRYHDTFVSHSRKPRDMSPSSNINRLWHVMLLNTDISSRVHELVGGVVRHAAMGEKDLSDNEKMMQRLYSMNVMASLGWKPNTRLWEEPGTIMSKLTIWQAPYGPDLFVADGMTQTDLAVLSDDVLPFFRKDRGYIASSECDSSDEETEDEGVMATRPKAPVGGYHSMPHMQGSFKHELRLYMVSTGKMLYLDSGHLMPTAGSLKQMLEDHIGTPAPQIRLMAVSFTHGDGPQCRLLGNAEFAGQGILRVLLPREQCLEAPLNPHHVFVKRLTGQVIDLSGRTAPWMLNSEFKDTIKDATGLSQDQQRLIFRSAQLEDSRTLEQSGVHSGSIVHLLLRLSNC